MPYSFRKIFKALALLLFLYAAGCHTASDSIIPAFNNYKFDAEVIGKLPVYDSLALAISEKIALFHKNINEENSYQAFRYMPASTETEVFKKLPQEIGFDADGYFARLGKNFIYGFDVFKDSSIKIYIRGRRLETTKVDIEENLSYYPAGRNIRHRDYPVKDSILNTHWQYWTRFSTPGLF